MARFRPDNALKVDFSQQYFQYFRQYLTGFEQYSGISSKQYLTDFNQYYQSSLPRIPLESACSSQNTGRTPTSLDATPRDEDPRFWVGLAHRPRLVLVAVASMQGAKRPAEPHHPAVS